MVVAGFESAPYSEDIARLAQESPDAATCSPHDTPLQLNTCL